MEYSMQSGDSYWQDGQLAESGADGSCGDATETAEYNSAEQHVVDSEKQFAMNDSEPTQLIGDPFDVANTDTNESDQVGDEQKRKSNGYSNSQYPFLTESLVYENTCSPTGDDHDQDHDHDQEAPEETQTPTEDSRDVPCEPDPKSDECEQMEVEETETGATEVEVESESEEAEKVQGEDDAVGSEEQAVEEIDGQDVESNASTERMADGDDQRSCSSVVIRDADEDADASEPVAAVAHANAEAESLENQADTSNEPEGEGEGEADSHTCFESESSEQMLSAFQAENRYVPHSEPLSVDDDEQGQSADSPLQSARNETSSLATQQEALVVDTKMIESAYHEDDDALVITDPLSAEQNGKPVSPPFSPSVEPANVTPQDSCLSPEAAAPSNQVDVADEESLSDTKHHDEHVAQETTRQSVCDAAAPKHCDDELGEHEHHEVLSAKHQDEEHVDQELHDVFTESSTTHQSVCMSPSDAAALKHQEVQNAAQQLHERDVMSQSDAAAVNQPEVEASVCGEQKAFEEIPQNLQSVQREAELRPDGDDSTAHLVPELMHFSPEHHNQATSMTEAATALEEKSGDACTTLESIPGNEQFANSNSHAETPSDVVKTSTPTAARDLESQHLDAGEQNLPDYALNGADNFKFVEQIEPQNVAQPTLEQVSEFSVESSVENRQNMQRSAHSADSQPCIEEVVVNFVDSNTERSTESRQITSGAEEQASRTEPVKIEEQPQPQPQQLQAQVNEQPAESQDAITGEHDARNEQITKWLEHTEAATQGGVDKEANKNSAVEANPNCTTKADEQTTEAQPIPLGGIESEQREQPAEPAPAATEKPCAPKTLPAKPRQIPTATNGTKKPEKAAPAPAATKSTAAPASAAAAKKPVEKPAQTPTGKAPPAPAAKAAPSKPTAAPSKTAGTSVAATKAVATPTKELPGPPLAKAAASASAKPAESAAKGAAKDAKAPAAAASKVPPPAASTGAATATAADKKAPAAAAAASQKRASLSLPQKTPLTSAKPAAAAPKAAPAKPSAPGPKAASSKISASNASLHKAK